MDQRYNFWITKRFSILLSSSLANSVPDNFVWISLGMRCFSHGYPLICMKSWHSNFSKVQAIVNFSIGNSQLFGTLVWTLGKALLILSSSHWKDPLKDCISQTSFTLHRESHSFSLCHLPKLLHFVLKSTKWNLVHIDSNPYTVAFSYFWLLWSENTIKIYHTLLWSKYFLDEKWRKESRGEISNPVLTWLLWY